jgi:hypothetical protein
MDHQGDYDDNDEEAFKELETSKGLAHWNNIIWCRGKLSRIISDKQFNEKEIIFFIEMLLKSIQRFCKTNHSMRTDKNSQPMSPGRSIGFLYRYIFPTLFGPKKSIDRMYKLALETATLVIKAESKVRDYAIKNPHSLRSAFNYLKEITPISVTADVSIISYSDPKVVYGQAQTKERIERDDRVIESKIADLVKSLKNLEIEMEGGYGPEKDAMLPKEWVEEYHEDDTDEESVEEEEKNMKEEIISEGGSLKEGLWSDDEEEEEEDYYEYAR